MGTPCQIQALRKVQLLEEPYQFGQEKIALLVGLFCMENFDYDALMNGPCEGQVRPGPKDVARFEIKKGMFRVIDKTARPTRSRSRRRTSTPSQDAVPASTSPASSRTSPWEAWARLMAGPQFSPARMQARSSTLQPWPRALCRRRPSPRRAWLWPSGWPQSKVKRFESKSVEMNVSGITR